MAWVVHHVQDDARDREVLNDGPAVRSVPARLGGVSLSVPEHLQHFVIGGDRPESLAIGSVDRRLVPPDRRNLPVGTEKFVREAVGEGIEIGEVDLLEVVRHPAILVAGSAGVKNGVPGA